MPERGRLDERVKALSSATEKLSEDMEREVRSRGDSLSRIENRLDARVATIRESLQTDYIREDRFSPIQKLVYGIVALTLTSVVGGVIAMVVSKPR